MTDDLSDLPGPVRAELTRLRAERVVFVAEREKLLGQLQEADTQLRALLADRDRLAGELEGYSADRPATREQNEALRGELATARQERDVLRSELAGTRTERDQLRLRLLDAELVLGGVAEPTAALASPAVNPHSIAAAEERAAVLARELAATKATVSWRVTAPLRAVRRRSRPR